MINKITIVTTGHPPLDERIFWKFAGSLSDSGYKVSIICSTQNINESRNGIEIKGFLDDSLSRNGKFNKLLTELIAFEPDLIICSEVSAIVPSCKYKKSRNNNCKIVSDITEWYPENVTSKKRGLSKIINFIFLWMMNIYFTNKCDYLIVGENKKKRRYDLIAPALPKILIGYYPVLKYFSTAEPSPIKDELVLCYAGLLNFDRGINQIINASEKLCLRNPGLKIIIKFAGKFQTESDESKFDEISSVSEKIIIEKIGWTNYDEMSSNFNDVHIFIDLRKRNFIYRNSLPIKLFEYMACGRPFIFSDIPPIRQNLDFNKFGALVNPENESEIVNAVEKYIKNPDLFVKTSKNARKLIETELNWESESIKLLRLIESLSTL